MFCPRQEKDLKSWLVESKKLFDKKLQFSVFLSQLHRFTNIDLFTFFNFIDFQASFTYSVAMENLMPINVGLKVSVYISIPVPLR
jgi:hypothetical protein